MHSRTLQLENDILLSERADKTSRYYMDFLCSKETFTICSPGTIVKPRRRRNVNASSPFPPSFTVSVSANVDAAAANGSHCKNPPWHYSLLALSLSSLVVCGGAERGYLRAVSQSVPSRRPDGDGFKGDVG